MEAIDHLNKKIDLLLKKHAAVVTENDRLRSIIDGQNKVIQSLNKKTATLENSMVSVKLHHTDVGDEEKEQMKAQLDAVIGEIDKILSTLND